MLSRNIQLRGRLALFLDKEWKRSSLADEMFPQLRFIKNNFTFPFVLQGVKKKKK